MSCTALPHRGMKRSGADVYCTTCGDAWIGLLSGPPAPWRELYLTLPPTEFLRQASTMAGNIVR
jgi:hypothetical protein